VNNVQAHPPVLDAKLTTNGLEPLVMHALQASIQSRDRLALLVQLNAKPVLPLTPARPAQMDLSYQELLASSQKTAKYQPESLSQQLWEV